MAPKKKGSSPMAVALNVVDKLMQQPVAVQLFNAPVDVQALPDYSEVVKKPMDLGTIRARLVAGQSKNDSSTAYASAADVLEDIKLVWNNCILYNSRPDEEQIAQAAREMSQKTEQLWGAAGLAGNPRSPLAPPSSAVTAEADIPSTYNVEGQSEIPVRIIEQLNVYGEERGAVRMWAIDCQLNALGALPGPSASSVPTAIFARGTLRDPQSGASSADPPAGLEVDIGPILDWSVSVEGDAQVFVSTGSAWYRVTSAAQEYEPLYLLPLLFARLCKAVVTSIQEMPAVELDGLLVLVCKYLLQTQAKDSLLFHIKLCIPQLRAFLLAWADAQEAVMAAALGSVSNSSGRRPVAPDAIHAARRLSEDLHALEGDNMEGRLKHVARVVGQLRQHYSGSGASGGDGKTPTAEEDYVTAMTVEPLPLVVESTLPASPGSGTEAEKRRAHLESKRVYEAERRRRKAAEEDLARSVAEAAAAAARGSPPPLRGGWRTPPQLLPNLLSVWDFLGTFADLLWLPPIPLARLDAALSPEAAAPSAADEASAYVLRDIHCALLRVLEGRAGKGAQPPKTPVFRSGRTNVIPCVGDHHWQVRLAKVLEGRAYDAAVHAEAHAAEALDSLRAGDYLGLSLTHRFAILNLLLSIALSTELLRNEIGYRVEDFHAIRLQERGLAATAAPKNGEKGKGGKGRKGSKAAAAAAAAAPATAVSGGTGDGSATATPNGSRGDRRNGAAVPTTTGDGAAKSTNTDGGKSDGVDDDTMTEDGSPRASRQGDGDGPGGEDEEETGEAEGEEGEDEDVAKDGMNAWWDFMYFSRVGLRRFLGMDALGRRYWLMAGRAGAYQVVVETNPHLPDSVTGNAMRGTSTSAEPLQWGVYIPSDIFKLTCWLRAGGMVQEEALLAALERAPLPQPEAGQPSSAAAWAAVPVAAAAADLDSMLPDGYKGVLAPALPGALIQPFTLPREDPPATVHARRALHAAASTLRFWAHNHADAAPAARSALLQLLLQLHGNSLQPSMAPRLAPPGAPPNPAATTESLRRDAAAVAEALTRAGAMGAQWPERRQRWNEMLAAAPSTRDLIALISVLCLNIAWRRAPSVMHRGSFHNFTATQHVPLYFPVPGDRIAILRSGLIANVQRIRDAVQSPPRWSGRDGRDGGGGMRSSSGAADGDMCKGGADVKMDADEEMKDVDAVLGAAAIKGEGVAGKAADALNGVTAAAAEAGKTQSDFPPVPPPTAKQEAWLQEMGEVEQLARTLRPVEMMSVAAVAYVPAEIPEAVQRGGWLCVTRPPTAWLLLRRDAPVGEKERPPLVLPVQADAALSDYVVPKATLERGLATRWQAGDRFRMQFGGRKGSWYRGMVVTVRGPLTGAMADPWEALDVKWEDGGSSAMPRVSPWEVELDPNSIEAKVAEQRSRLQKECRRARTSKRTAEGAPENEPDLLRQRSDTLSGTLPGATPHDPHALATTGDSREPRSSRSGTRRGGASINLADLPTLLPSPLQLPPSRHFASTIAADLLAKVPDGDAFQHMIANFHNGRGNTRYRVPHFHGGPLDLSALFSEVLGRGGGNAITQSKTWKDVVKVMGLDSGSGVTTTNLRNAYEKSLRCFELYMRSGAFARDAAADQLPPQAQTFSRQDLARFWHGSGIPEYATFAPYDPVPAAASAAAAAAPAAAKQPATVKAKPVAAAAAAAAAPAPAAAAAHAATNGAAAAAPAAVVQPPQALPQLKMAPQGPDPTPPSQNAQDLIGKDVWRKWEGRGFYRATVDAYDAESNVFIVRYNKGTKQEMEERMNLFNAPVELSWRDPNHLVRAGSAQGAHAVAARP
eukprot:jgi/Ulvmu1/716/UM010_0088.1